MHYLNLNHHYIALVQYLLMHYNVVYYCAEMELQTIANRVWRGFSLVRRHEEQKRETARSTENPFQQRAIIATSCLALYWHRFLLLCTIQHWLFF